MGFAPCDPVVDCDPAFPPIDWEESDCPLCGGSDWSQKIEAPEPGLDPCGRWFLIVECRHCNLCYTNPRPTAACLRRLYPHPTPDAHRDARQVHKAWWQQRQIGDPLRRIWPLIERGELLDFGHGVSSLLGRLHQRGRPFTAVNLSPSAAGFLRQQWHVPASAGSLPHKDVAGLRFDTITLFDSLQCIPRPLELLQSTHDILTDGGLLVISVPNIDSLPFRWFGADWPGLNLPRHLTHFTPRSLRLILHQAGFRLLALRPLRHSGWLRRAACNVEGRSRYAGGWGNLLKIQLAASMLSRYSALVGRANGMLAVAGR
jgi:SAM-dependent methyltransferase